MPEKHTSKKAAASQEKKDEKTVSQKEETAAPEKKRASGGKKKCLLIVEDEHPLAHALELKFTHEGFETYIATDGVAAIEMVREHNPHVILLDLIMPKMDGFAFLEEIKKIKCKAHVIVLSNLGQDEDRERADEFGAKGYFVKANTPIIDIVKHVKSLL